MRSPSISVATPSIFSRYTTMPIEGVIAQFHTTLAKGLNPARALKLLRQYGANSIKNTGVPWWHILARQFQSSFVYLLIAAAILSLILKEFIDAGMVILFITINAGLGFYQEFRSEQTIQSLEQFVVVRARVRRGGKEILIPNEEIVPGDVVLVESGDIIPADVRFGQENNLMVDESILTGESAPVKKHARALATVALEAYKAHNIGFMGTVIAAGVGEGIVVATGRNAMMGTIAKLSIETVRESSFEKGIRSFSSFILRMVVATLVFVVLSHVFIKGNALNMGELIIFAIALAVSVIPEGLPLVTTFSLSRGALRLAHHHVVVKRLSAIEDLGGIEVLCTDKTGTLTENSLTVENITGDDAKRTLFYANMSSTIIHSNADNVHNAFDTALWKKLTREQRQRLKTIVRITGVPFDPSRRRDSILIERDGQCELVVRGAPELIARFSHLSSHRMKELNQWIAQQGRLGRRTIAVARKIMERCSHYAPNEETAGLEWLGCVSLTDPIKKTTKHAIHTAQLLGVKVKILTGDSREVAGAVACEIGLVKRPKEVITGEELEALSAAHQLNAVQEYHVFARVSPQQKYKIIELLQHHNEVGFLGEGINDAPALKKANVGIVVQSAADIARDAADIVLLEQSLGVIVDGIRMGREVFANTIKYIKATLASNFGNFYAVATASLILPYLPMLPLQILLVNLLSDFPMTAIATDTIDPAELKKPKGYEVKEIALVATVLGLVSTIFDFIFFGLFQRFGPGALQTNWFIGSILTELAFLFSVRTRLFFLKARRPSGILMSLTGIAAIATITIPQLAIGQTLFRFTPPSSDQMMLIISIVGIYFVLTETVKNLYYRWMNRTIPSVAN